MMNEQQAQKEPAGVPEPRISEAWQIAFRRFLHSRGATITDPKLFRSELVSWVEEVRRQRAEAKAKGRTFDFDAWWASPEHIAQMQRKQRREYEDEHRDLLD